MCIIIPKNIRNIVSVLMEKCKLGKQWPHTLLYGPPGVGKTSIPKYIAKKLGKKIAVVESSNLTFNSIVKILRSAPKGAFLLVDELHTAKEKEFLPLYRYMEEGKVITGGGSSFNVDITVFGATTLKYKVPKPLQTRFKLFFDISYYDDETMASIISNSLQSSGISYFSDSVVDILVKASKGIPRIGNRLVQLVSMLGKDSIGADEVKNVLKMQDIDENGLNQYDRIYLNFLKEFGSPVGISIVAAATGIDKNTILEEIEPYLIRKGYISVTPRGRIYNKVDIWE